MQQGTIINIVKEIITEMEFEGKYEEACALLHMIEIANIRIPQTVINGYGKFDWHCPICDNDELREGFAFCPDCGQALLWHN